MVSETTYTNFLTGTAYDYSESKNGGYLVRAHVGSNRKTIQSRTLTTRFEKDVDIMKANRSVLLASMALSVVFGLVTLFTRDALCLKPQDFLSHLV